MAINQLAMLLQNKNNLSPEDQNALDSLLSQSTVTGQGNNVDISGGPSNALSALLQPPQAPQQPAPTNYIKNNQTGAVTDLGKSYVERPAPVPAPDANSIMRFAQQNNINPSLVPAMIQYQTQTGINGSKMPSATDLYRQSFQSGIPFEDLLKNQTIQQQGNLAAQGTNLKNEGAAADIAKTRAMTDNLTGVTGAVIDPDTLKTMAQQYRAGDTSVMANLGRGVQGAKNIVALRQEINRQTQEAGGNGADIAAKNAEFIGQKAAQRTIGTKSANTEMAANEANSLIPLARTASDAVARSGFLPFGKAQIMFDDQTNDPALRQFAAANNSLVNVYARAISPTGQPNLADKEHARAMLSAAFDQKSYNATLDQMQKEIDAARASPKMVRQEFSDSITGRNSTAPSAPAGWKIERAQ